MSLYKTGSFFGIFLVNFHENSREPCGRMSLGQDGYWSKWRAAACKSQVAPRSPERGGGAGLQTLQTFRASSLVSLLAWGSFLQQPTVMPT